VPIFPGSCGLVARTLAPVHVVAVAPADPSGLAAYNGIIMRSLHTGRIRHWMLRNVNGIEMAATLNETLVVNDPAAVREAARLDLGVSLIALFDVLRELERGHLIRLLPDWYADAGAVSLCYASRTLIAAKTRVFVDFLVNAFKSGRLEHFHAGPQSIVS
jgi:DNA-binding transcriptional LysR family regulator